MASQSFLATGKYHFSAWIGDHDIDGDSVVITDKSGYTKITPSPNADKLYCIFLVQPVDSDALLYVGGDTSKQQTIPTGKESLTLTNLKEIIVEFDVTGGVETDIYFNTNADWIVKCWTVYDKPADYLESGDTGYVDMSLYYKARPLSCTVVQNIVDCQETIIENLRKTHVNIFGMTDGESLETLTPSTTWKNFFDTDYTSYDEVNSPGFWIRPGAPYAPDTTVQQKCRVRASSVSGNAQIKFINDTNESSAIEVTSSSPTWYSVYLYVDVPGDLYRDYATKIDMMVKDASEGSIQIYNIIIEEQDASN